MIYHTLGI